MHHYRLGQSSKFQVPVQSDLDVGLGRHNYVSVGEVESIERSGERGDEFKQSGPGEMTHPGTGESDRYLAVIAFYCLPLCAPF